MGDDGGIIYLDVGGWMKKNLGRDLHVPTVAVGTMQDCTASPVAFYKSKFIMGYKLFKHY